MSSIQFTAQFLVYKQPAKRRPIWLLVATAIMLFFMVWGLMQGMFLFVLLLAPALFTGSMWRKANAITEVRTLPASLSVADNAVRVYVEKSYLSEDGSRYLDHCYLFSRDDLESIELDETCMFLFRARFIRAFAMEDGEVVERFDDSNHAFTFRVDDATCRNLEDFLVQNGFSVTHVDSADFEDVDDEEAAPVDRESESN